MLRRLLNFAGAFAALFLLTTSLLHVWLPANIFAAEPAVPAGKDEIKAVREAWQKRFESSRSWKCEVDANLVIPKGAQLTAGDEGLSPEVAKRLEVEGPFPFQETTHKVPFVLFVDRQAGLRRSERTDCHLDITSLQYESRFHISAYNGKLVWSNTPTKKAGGMRIIHLHDQSQCSIEYVDLPIYFAHGMFPHVTGQIDWNHPDRSTAHHLKIIVDGTKVIGGTRCLRIRNPTDNPNIKYTLYLDPQRDYAIVRYELLSSNGLHRTIDVTEYRLQDGLHLPFSWQAAHFGGGGGFAPPPSLENPQPMEKLIAKVKRYEINPPLDKSLFKMPSDGKIVLQDQRPKKKN